MIHVGTSEVGTTCLIAAVYQESLSGCDLRSPRLSILHNGQMKPIAAINPLVLAVWSIWMIGGFGFYSLGNRLWCQLDGIVITSRDIPSTRGPRYVTEYTLRGPDGRESLYASGSTDSSLPRSMPVGTVLKKKRWHLDYERDGRRISDFSLPFYLGILAIAFGCLGWSVLLLRRQRW